MQIRLHKNRNMQGYFWQIFFKLWFGVFFEFSFQIDLGTRKWTCDLYSEVEPKCGISFETENSVTRTGNTFDCFHDSVLDSINFNDFLIEIKSLEFSKVEKKQEFGCKNFPMMRKEDQETNKLINSSLFRWRVWWFSLFPFVPLLFQN